MTKLVIWAILAAPLSAAPEAPPARLALPGPRAELIGGERKVPPGHYAELWVELAPGDKASWLVYPRPLKKTDRGDGWLQFAGEQGKVYTVAVTVVNFDAKRFEQREAEVAFIGDSGGTDPPKTDPPKTDPPKTDPPGKDPPPPAPGTYYLMVVRPDGPASPAFTKLMADPAWADLRKKGHTVKDFTLSTARSLKASVPDSLPLPAVVVLQVSEDGKTASQVRAAVPVTAATIPTLLDGLK